MKILGFGNRESRELHKLVERALKELDLHWPVRDVNDLDKILAYKAPSVPAVALGGKVIYAYNKTNSSWGDKLKQVKTAISDHMIQAPIMENIIVPIDYSDCSRNSLHFAMSLAHFLDCQLRILHIHHPRFDAANPYTVMVPDDFQKSAESRLKNFVDEFVEARNTPDKLPEYSNECIVGFAAEEILKASKSKCDLIVMGKTGSNDALNKWFGSISRHVASKADCPVLLVPSKSQFKGFDKVAYSSDFMAEDVRVVKELCRFLVPFDSMVHLIHVHTKDERPEALLEKKEWILSELDEYAERFVEIEDDTIVEGIQHYISDREIDLLAMATGKRGFIEKLFHKSITRSVQFQSDIPVLIFHYL